MPDARVRIAFLRGIAGIGKSSLLAAFLRGAGADGHRVVALDGRTVEPTEAGFVAALGGAVGRPGADLVEIVVELERDLLAVIGMDDVESLRLLDTWFRQVLIPALPGGVRVVMAGREPPVAGWLTSPGLEGATRTIQVGPLDEADAMELLRASGVDEVRARELNRIARGHPLALRLAAATLTASGDPGLDEIAAHKVIDALARRYMADVHDPDARTALEAGSVVRRVTRSLLRAMVPGGPADHFEALASLPFVEARSDGLLIHDAVREAIARNLKAIDPSCHRDYRRRAWRLANEVQGAASDELWRYTADMLFLIENPVVREAFFPSGAQPLAVEPAPRAALPAPEAITARHDGPVAVSLMRRWWDGAPSTFSIVRDRAGDVAGYLQLLTSEELRAGGITGDPVVDAWREHLRQFPVPRGQLVLGFRRWLALDQGEAPSPCQAATWLDVKRTYMAMRPQLRRIYVAVRDAGTYWPVVERLGFRPLPERWAQVDVGDDPHTSVMLDFGPQSVDGWLSGLVAAELGVTSWSLDPSAHEVDEGGRRIRLTPLEFAVLERIQRIPGRTVPRRELLEDVWGWDGTANSNVVDAVVRRLRQKLEGRVDVETVRGAGYRIRDA